MDHPLERPTRSECPVRVRVCKADAEFGFVDFELAREQKINRRKRKFKRN